MPPPASPHARQASTSSSLGSAPSRAASTMACTRGSEPHGCCRTRDARSDDAGPSARASVHADAVIAARAAELLALGSAAASPVMRSGLRVHRAAYKSQKRDASAWLQSTLPPSAAAAGASAVTLTPARGAAPAEALPALSLSAGASEPSVWCAAPLAGVAPPLAAALSTSSCRGDGRASLSRAFRANSIATVRATGFTSSWLTVRRTAFPRVSSDTLMAA
mmetsp:Transcript_35983/g.106362  ORF Transcript_35983/g.106362 Transcript_35983/m.106362 type:complete len:221 (-) Transcript_35983:69-731(-)